MRKLLFVFISCYNKSMKNSDWPLVGNGHISAFLSKSIKNKKIAGFYIFCGPENLGKDIAAVYFAKVLLCQNRKDDTPCDKCISCRKFKVNKGDSQTMHSDLYFLEKEDEKKNISIEKVRDFISKLSMSSFMNTYKIGIIYEAHSLSTEAANALLKTLEEPKKNVAIIMITPKIESLPQTIASRSQILKFNPVQADKIHDYLVEKLEITRSAAKNFAHLSMGRPMLALKFIEDKEFYQDYLDKVKIFIDFFNKDINERFGLLGGLSNEKKSNQENVSQILKIIKIWEGIIRDLLLLELEQNDLISNEIVRADLVKIKEKYKTGQLLKISTGLRQAEKYLLANVNPKLVLE